MAAKKVPTIGAEANRLDRWRLKIKAMTKKLEDEKRAFDADKEAFRARLVAEGVDGARGTKATASVGTREVATIEDYGRLERYIYREKALDLMQNRISITAVRERQEAGEKIPGLGIEHLPTLTLRTRK